MATMQTLSGKDPKPIGNAHFVHVPFNTFTARDGLIVITVITDSFWQSLVDVINIDSLRNIKFTDQPGRLANKSFIESELNRELLKKDSSYWEEVLNNSKVPCAPINSFSQALKDEQVIYRNMVVEVNHPDGGKVNMPGNPIKLSHTNEESFSPPPHLGQNTEEVLREWTNYEESRINKLIDSGIIESKL